ncbi:hypothetical protein AMS68_005695 [Peltaster fructicola]|uniref:Uncharacterized protein n=1 Tax=Peltaster fructicola TaxID=286661 RepID=A0A6H0Y009_9PEZI|nr:hypothetical protein AMS68_005695 [Peltaster fructicola]
MNSLSWFNSTHNLDCVTGPDVGNGTACINSQGQWCTPYREDTTCTSCNISVCTGFLPPSPPGYGPPDQINVTFSDGTACTEMNPQGYRRHEVGNDIVPCSGGWQYIYFYGSSNAAINNGSISFGASGSCSNGSSIYGNYGASFEIDCTHDSGFNATCHAKSNVAVSLTSFELSNPSS